MTDTIEKTIYKCHSIVIWACLAWFLMQRMKEIVFPFNIDLPDDFSKVSSDDEIGFNNLNTDLKTGFNNLNTDSAIPVIAVNACSKNATGSHFS